MPIVIGSSPASGRLRVLRILLGLGVALGLLLVGPEWNAAAASPAVKDREDAVQVFSRDVFVVSGTGDLIPADPATVTPQTALFNVAGAPLGLTWGQFSGASATAATKVSAHRAGTRTDARLRLRGLIPQGVYSIFYITFSPDSENPLCPGVDRSLALTSADAGQQPDPASFVADAKGTAEFHGRVSGDLLAAAQLSFVLIYHADGQTYGALANRAEAESQGDPICRSSYGADAIRQLLILQKVQ